MLGSGLPVLDLLLLDPHNPHALAFQLTLIDKGLAELNAEFGAGLLNPLQGPGQRLLALEPAALEPDLFGEVMTLAGLVQLLEQLTAGSAELCERLTLRYFSHTDRATLYRVNA